MILRVESGMRTFVITTLSLSIFFTILIQSMTPVFYLFLHIISRFGLVMVFSYLLVGWATFLMPFFFFLDMLFRYFLYVPAPPRLQPANHIT